MPGCSSTSGALRKDPPGYSSTAKPPKCKYVMAGGGEISICLQYLSVSEFLVWTAELPSAPAINSAELRTGNRLCRRALGRSCAGMFIPTAERSSEQPHFGRCSLASAFFCAKQEDMGRSCTSGEKPRQVVPCPCLAAQRERVKRDRGCWHGTGSPSPCSSIVGAGAPQLGVGQELPFHDLQ